MEMSIKRGNGLYVTNYPVFAEAVITYFVKASRSEARSTPKVAADRPAAKSPYEVLNVRRGATREEVVSAYREMCKLYHPDKVAHLAPEFKDIAEARMREINAAYQRLTR
jgi:DnaJ-class molecular chaperone